MDALKSTFIHTLEVAVILSACYIALTFLGVDSAIVKDVVGLTLVGFAKYVRASNDSFCKKIPDYVNK